ncbi:OmpA family protein [Costertonia aggregata]|uniref:OmpA family protein n=1 Tax=Costertonia aggregata TaxID=343403 RepID=A0A7H9ANB7_9FLAO|nr:OmpA family protein [Costertonia aggregata]QLG44928.1 OmpA family protein [Costertonia aggregata]
MKIFKIAVLIAMLSSFTSVEAQFFKKLKKKVEKAAEETVLDKADKKTRKKTGKAIDKTIDGKPGEAKGKNKKTEETTNNTETSEQETVREKNVFEAYSKFDFETGKNLVAFEDFSNETVGDIPTNWNVTGATEIVTLSNHDGKWLRTSKGSSALIPDFVEKLPENFTLEYDVIYDFDITSWSNNRKFNLVFSNLENPDYDLDKVAPGSQGFSLLISGGIGKGGQLYMTKYGKDKRLNINDKKSTAYLNNNNGRGQIMHFSVWKQGKRLRVYLDEEKIFDAPRAFQTADALKTMRFFSRISPKDSYFFLGNVRFAEGAPETRTNLLDKGELTTYGITFNKGSASIKPSSYAVLKTIAAILKENNDLFLEIEGHTDTDGSEETNLKLSQKRAETVRDVLITSFDIKKSRLTAIGKGENELLAKGNTPSDHAKNRRVVFKRK